MWFLYLVIIAFLALAIYWLLVTTEGTYLGARIVALMYNKYARRYDKVKHFDPQYESFFLSRPMLHVLQGYPEPLVLDVATGTGRVPLLLLAEDAFSGRVLGLDFAYKMLEVAAQKAAHFGDRVTWVWQNAIHLPFPDDSFDLVTCLEALEFTPSPVQVLREMVRVSRPGACIITTRRCGWESKVMPGKAWSKQVFTELLEEAGLVDVRFSPWQADYDLVWAWKDHSDAVAEKPKAEWPAGLLHCPGCNGRRSPLEKTDTGWYCPACNLCYPVANSGIIELAHGKACKGRL